MKIPRFSLRTLLLLVVAVAAIAAVGRVTWNSVDPPQVRYLRDRGLTPAHYTVRKNELRFAYFSDKLNGSDLLDLSPLATFPHLEVLCLRRLNVEDFTPLHNMKDLQWIDLRETQITAAQIDRLQQALPNCELKR